MRKLTLLCFAILIAMNATGQVNFDTYLNNGVYTFDDVFKVTRYEIFDTYKSQFGLTSDDIMELIDEDYIKVDTTDTIRTGSMHARYQQKYTVRPTPAQQKVRTKLYTFSGRGRNFIPLFREQNGTFLCEL